LGAMGESGSGRWVFGKGMSTVGLSQRMPLASTLSPFQFTLSNNGNEPLIISTAQASCGCTNLNYSKEPILPGKSTTISVTYNAAVKGNFYKSVTVRTNASDQPTVLLIKGTVVEKPAEEKK